MNHRPKPLPTFSKGLICLITAIFMASAAGPWVDRADAAQPATEPLDLVFVIDNSGSMKKNDPEFLTRDAVKGFIEQLSQQARVGMVLFDENVRLLHRLRIISSPRVKQQFIRNLEKIDYAGKYTNSPGGIERALYELKTNGRAESRKAIVFITDGFVTTGSKIKNSELTQWLKEDLTRESKQLGIQIYGVAFTEAANFSLIQTLASRTEGEYFRAQDAKEIALAFSRIQQHLKATSSQPADLQPLPLLTPAEKEPSSDPSDPPVVVVTQTPWILYIWLTLIFVMMAAAVILFYTKYYKAEKGMAPSIQPIIHLPKALLQDLDGACRGTATTLSVDKATMTIGRGLQSDICIPQTTISKHHATIQYQNLVFSLIDLKSTNGTWINDERIPPHKPIRLNNGDRIGFSEFKFQFHLPELIPTKDTILVARTSLNNPEDQATIMVDLENTNIQDALVACLQYHLMQIEALGPKFKTFVRSHLHYDTLQAIAAQADENLKKSQDDLKLHCSSLVKQPLFYLICSLPVEISEAGKWYGATYGGFTQFALQWARSETYRAAQCDMICIVTFGQIPTHWVSITIVPTHDEPDPVEIISVDFLNPEEKAALALDHGSEKPNKPASGDPYAKTQRI